MTDERQMTEWVDSEFIDEFGMLPVEFITYRFAQQAMDVALLVSDSTPRSLAEVEKSIAKSLFLLSVVTARLAMPGLNELALIGFADAKRFIENDRSEQTDG